MSVCLSVCPLSELEFQTAEFHQSFMHVACDSVSVLLWRDCDTLCTSGFVDDVIFTHMFLWRVMYVFLKRRQNTTNITAETPTKFCSTIKTESTL